MTLREEAARLYDANDHDALFALAARSWPEGGDMLPDGVGEVCRYAAIRAHSLGRVDRFVWRARALTAAVLTGARDTAAGLLLQSFFGATDAAGEQPADGGHSQARRILDEIRRLVPENTPEWRTLFGRLYHGKRAFSFLMEGTSSSAPSDGRRRCLDEAEAEYSRALPFATHDERGTLKLRGALALTRYLRLAYNATGQGRSPEVTPLLEETRAIAASAKERGYRDVAEWAATNSDVMDRGASTGWAPYEVV
jgi:hypothetical protein